MRDLLFISHANPEDNEFARWLTLRLARAGYRVWCDLTNLLGGEITWMDIEEAVRGSAIKFIYVLSKYSNEKDGVRKELAIAETVGNSLGDRDFIIPIKIDDISYADMNIEIHRRNAIPFVSSWAVGLEQLLAKLDSETVPKEPKIGPPLIRDWWRLNFDPTKGVRQEEEEHLSNWFEMVDGPKEVFVHRVRDSRLAEQTPCCFSTYQDYIFSFSSAQKLGIKPHNLVSSVLVELKDFLNGDIGKNRVTGREARGRFVELLNNTWKQFIEQTKLPGYEFADKVKAQYFPDGYFEGNKIVFIGVNGKKTYRQMSGVITTYNQKSRTTSVSHWHFGFRSRALLSPIFGYEIKAHVLFSDDGHTIWPSKNKLHKKRRSYCKNWWNNDWRDRIVAVMSWLSGGQETINIPLSEDLMMRVSSMPQSFISPVSYSDPGEVDAESLDYEAGEVEDDIEDEEPSA